MKQRVGRLTWVMSVTTTVACIVLAGSLAVSSPAYAVDPTPTPTPTPTPVPKPVPKPLPKPATHLPVGRGSFGPLVRLVQTRLLWVGMPVKVTGTYDRTTAKATKSFQQKFGLKATSVVNTSTYKRLASLTQKRGRLPAICRKSTRILCIDKSQKVVRYIKKNHLVAILDARFGGYRTPTREGLFRVYSKDADHTSSQFHTWMPFAMFFSGGQAVHFSPYFRRDGYAGASHGCVNLRSLSSARALFAKVPVGTKVYVYHSLRQPARAS